MMKKLIFLLMIVAAGSKLTLEAAPADTLVLNLSDAIRLAQQQSPSAQQARNAFLAAYWNYRSFRANYLPSVMLSSSPYINKEMNKITQYDGTAQFIRQDQLGADLQLTVSQNISLTGGNLFVKSGLNRLDELQNKTTAYSSQPLSLGYEQSLFGYNSLKWDRILEPLRYREAKKTYAEALELVSATTCNYFFSLAAAQMECDMARQNYASADTLYRMAQGRYRIGTITENEMLQLEINRLNEETNMMDADINLKEQLRSLRSFLGLDQQCEVRLEMPDSVPHFEVPVRQALDLALQNSPDPDSYQRLLKESESNLAKAKANSGLKADLYVQFGLSQTGSDIKSSYRNLCHQEYARVTVALPILDWGRGKGRVKVAKSQLELTHTTVQQGMDNFCQNVQKLVWQFNMQARKVHIASLTDRRADQRYAVAKKLYIMGRNSLLDLNASVNEKNAARRGKIASLQTFWSLYYTLRSMTAFDFEHQIALSEQLPTI